MPTWTSSQIRSAPVSSHSLRARAKYSGSPVMIPPSPWRASSMIAATLRLLRLVCYKLVRKYKYIMHVQ